MDCLWKTTLCGKVPELDFFASLSDSVDNIAFDIDGEKLPFDLLGKLYK